MRTQHAPTSTAQLRRSRDLWLHAVRCAAAAQRQQQGWECSWQMLCRAGRLRGVTLRHPVSACDGRVGGGVVSGVVTGFCGAAAGILTLYSNFFDHVLSIVAVWPAAHDVQASRVEGSLESSRRELMRQGCRLDLEGTADLHLVEYCLIVIFYFGSFLLHRKVWFLRLSRWHA